jgi:RNA recognition motif-containing protein
MNIYVGNLSREVNEDDLLEAFKIYGQVGSVKVIKDKYTGESRGFGFVEMPNNSEADSAIKGLNGSKIKDSLLKISEALPRSEKRRKGRGGRGEGRYR